MFPGYTKLNCSCLLTNFKLIFKFYNNYETRNDILYIMILIDIHVCVLVDRNNCLYKKRTGHIINIVIKRSKHLKYAGLLSCFSFQGNDTIL